MHRKLTIINQQYPPEVAATGQIFSLMAGYMRRNGWETTVVTGTPYYPGMTEKPPRRETLDGVDVRRLRNTTFDKRSFFGKLLNLLTFEISLFFYCIFCIGRDETVLVATAPPIAVFCTAIGRFFRRYHVVMTVQDLYPDVLQASGMSSPAKLSYRVLHRIMRWSMHRCDRVIAISTDMKARLEADYGLADVRLVPNLSPEAIDVLDPIAAKTPFGWEDTLVVQYSGNFGVAHEYGTLLAAVRLLTREPDILFRITGAGKNYDKLKAESEAEGLTNIVFEGYAPLDRLQEHLAVADLSLVVFNEAFEGVLLPSKYYGILASGRGVLLISGAHNDIRRDIDRHGVGLSFAHGEAGELAEALLALRQAPDRLRAMGSAARALYDERYTQAVLLEAYDNVLREIDR